MVLRIEPHGMPQELLLPFAALLIFTCDICLDSLPAENDGVLALLNLFKCDFDVR